MKPIRFAVIGDCHYTTRGNYATRDCLGAKKQLGKIIDILNRETLDFVLSLGDLGDGNDMTEIPEMLEVYASSKNPVHFTIGNHDLVLRTADKVASLMGMPAPFYDFSLDRYRFIVLNAFEQSRYCPPDSAEYKAYRKFRDDNPDLKVQEWPGLMTDASWKKLENLLSDSVSRQQNVILISHVPVWFGNDESAGDSGGGILARIPDYQKMLDVIDKYPNIRAYIAGHYHHGCLARRNGILYKTVHSVCDHPDPTFCIMQADETAIHIRGFGAETDLELNF